MLRDWKLNYVVLKGDGTEEGHGTVDLDISDDYISIPVYPNKKKMFNRAKEKREFQKRLKEELEKEW